MKIQFRDEHEQHWQDILEQERNNHDATKLLNRDGYSHPNDPTLKYTRKEEIENHGQNK